MQMSSLQCSECGAPIRGSAGLGVCGACGLRAALCVAPAEAKAGAGEEFFIRRTGDYELLDEIARGGMGVVYRARQRSLGRTVALKVLLGGAFAGADGRRRLRAEAAAAAKLQHPGIIAVHDTGELDGQPFYAMEFVAGRTLADIVRDGPLPAKRAAHYAAKLAEAVAYAHEQGVVHRDLKPSNVLVDANDQPRITDFGLAKEIAGDAGHTLTGTVLGSPGYMSPEQAAGRSREVGPASDVYSLGALLYELLTGRAPFQGETAHAVLDQVQHLDPVPLRRLSAGVPMDLENICLKCLEKEPARRYSSAGELEADLNRFLRGEPVRARPLGPAGRMWRWVRQHRALAAALALVMLLLLGGATGATLAALRIMRAERATVANLRESLLEQSRGRRLAGGLGTRSDILDSLRRATALGLDESQRLRARSEAIAALALDEVRFVPLPQLPRSEIFRSALDPTYRWFAHLEGSNTVVIRHLSDGREFARLGTSPARRLNGQPEFTADGGYLAILWRDGLDIWSVTNRALCFSNPGPTNAFAFSGDGRLFALFEADGSVSLRELPDGRVRHRLSPGSALPTTPTMDARRLGLSSDGRRLAVVQAMTNCVDVFDFASGTRLLRVAQGASAKNVTWSGDDTLLGVACQAGPIQVWDLRTGDLDRTYQEGNDAFRCLAFHPREPWFAAVSPQNHLDLRQRLTGRLLAEAPVDANKVAFDPDGSRLGPVWMGGQVGWLETRRSENFRSISVGSPQTPSWHVSFSPNGRTLAVCSRNELTLLDPGSLTPLAAMTNRAFYFAGFDRAGFLWTTDPAGVHRWQPNLNRPGDPKWRKLETRWRGPEWRSLAFSSDGKWLAGANRSLGRLTVAPLRSSTNAIAVGVHPGARWTALDRAGRLAVTANSENRRLKVWTVADSTLLLEVAAGGNGGRAAFSPDGRWLATFGEEGLLWTVGQWTNAAATLFPSGETGLGEAAFSADSRWLAVVVNLREIHLFATATAQRVAVFRAPEALGILAISLSPDGRWLVALCHEGRLQRWDLAALRRDLASRGLDWR